MTRRARRAVSRLVACAFSSSTTTTRSPTTSSSTSASSAPSSTSCATIAPTSTSCLPSAPDRVVVSPGPVHPERGRHLARGGAALPAAGIPTLGVCLGHQALAQAFGGRVVRHHPVHGKTGVIEHDGRTIYRGSVVAADGRALPLADRRRRAARLPRGERARRRRRDGDPPPRAARPRASSSTPSRSSPTRAWRCSRNFLARMTERPERTS